MNLQYMIKGFLTIRFLIGFFLAFLAFYSSIQLFVLWDQEEATVKKIITFLALVVSIALMYIMESPYHIKRFALGAGRYNQLRQVNELGFPTYEKQKYAKMQSLGQKQAWRKINRFEHSLNKIKKIQSLTPADFLKQTMNYNTRDFKKEPLPHPINKLHRAFTLATPQIPEGLNAQERQMKDQQYNEALTKYKQYTATSKLNQDWQQTNNNKAKTVLANIFKNEINKQLDNIQLIQNKLQSLFDIKIVDSLSAKDYQYSNNRSQSRENRGRGNIKLGTNIQLTFDQIFQKYESGLLKQSGYKLRSKPSQDLQYRFKMLKQIQKLMMERQKLDRLINYKQPFINHFQRLNMIEKLKEIVKYFEHTKHFFENQSDLLDEFEMKQLIIWILSKHINGIVAANFNEATVFIDDRTENINRPMMIRWKLAKYTVLVHYDVVIDVPSQKDGKNTPQGAAARVLVCKPGDYNIQSLFVTYLNYLNQFFRIRLQIVPELFSYVNQIL